MAFKRFIEALEELFTKKGDESILRYQGRDFKYRYVKGYSTPDGEPALKTINEQSLKGTGDIPVAVPVPVIEVEGDEPEQELAPNTYYKFGTVDSIDLTLGEGEEGVMNIYAFSFTASEDFDPSTGISWPEGVRLNGELEIEAGQECEVSIYDGKAAFMVWDAPETPSSPGQPVVDG